MKFRTLAAAAALAVIGAGAVVAADEPQVVRQQMMKKVGGAMGALSGIAKGEKPYDAEVVKASLTTMSEVAKASWPALMLRSTFSRATCTPFGHRLL